MEIRVEMLEKRTLDEILKDITREEAEDVVSFLKNIIPAFRRGDCMEREILFERAEADEPQYKDVYIEITKDEKLMLEKFKGCELSAHYSSGEIGVEHEHVMVVPCVQSFGEYLLKLNDYELEILGILCNTLDSLVSLDKLELIKEVFKPKGTDK